MFLTKSW